MSMSDGDLGHRFCHLAQAHTSLAFLADCIHRAMQLRTSFRRSMQTYAVGHEGAGHKIADNVMDYTLYCVKRL